MNVKRIAIPHIQQSRRLALLALLFLAGAVFPLAVQSIYYVDLAVRIGIYSLIAIGLNVLYGNTGQISLGQAAFYGLGAYISALLAVKLGLNVWASMLAATLLSGAFGYGVGLTAVRLKHNYLAMATIAFGIIFTVVVGEWSSLTGGVGGLVGIPPLAVGGYLLNTEIQYYYVVFVVLALVFLFTKNVVSSRVGRALVAIAENDVAASASGIHATQYKLQIFALSAAYAGLAGALFAHYARYIGPNSFSLHFSIALMFMIMLGGRGNVWGGVLGAGLLTLLPEFLRHAASLAVLPQTLRGTLTEFSYQLVLYGVLVFLFTIFLPEGLAGAIATVWRRLRPTPLGEWTAAPAESGAAGPRHAFLSQDSSALGIAQASPPDQSGKVNTG